MKSLLIILVLLISGCATTVRVGVLHDFKRNIDGDNPMAIVEVSYPVTATLDCGYTHISHWTSGPPFDNRPEQNADTLGCYWRIY